MPFDSTNYESDATIALRKVHDHLSIRNNWCIGHNNSWGRVCVIGAVNLFVDYRTERSLNDHIVDLLYASMSNMPTYNETKRGNVKNHNDGMGHADMLEWLRETIDRSVRQDKNQ